MSRSLLRVSLALLVVLMCSVIVSAQPSENSSPISKSRPPIRNAENEASGVEGQWILSASGDIENFRRGLPDFVKTARGLSNFPADLLVSLDVLHAYDSPAFRGAAVRFNLQSNQGRSFTSDERRNYHSLAINILADHPQINDIEQDQVVQAWGDFSAEAAQPANAAEQHEVSTMGKVTVPPGTPYPEPSVTSIYSLPSDNSLWGLDRLDKRPKSSLDRQLGVPSTGAGVTVYVIDTGILTNHEQFQTSNGSRASFGASFLGSAGNSGDGNGHGTHCAGTIGGKSVGVARDANLVGIQVLDSAGSGSTSGVIAGINWVTNNARKPAVVSMSLGGGFSSSMNSAVTSAIASGIPFTVAAGNEGADACRYSPASTPTAITVGAVDSTDTIASFSNQGSCVTLSAPGVTILSSWSTATNAYKKLSGTSMATPHTAGAMALYMQRYPTATPAQLKSDFQCFSTQGVISRLRTGTPNKLLYNKVGTAPLGTAKCYV